MRPALPAALLMAAAAALGFPQSSPRSEVQHVAFECRDVAETASGYLSTHGILTLEEDRFQVLSVIGRRGQPLAVGGSHELGARKLMPWTDIHGNEISDFKIYWHYADRGTAEKLPLGVWRLRLSHYRPQGEMKLAPAKGECDVNFRLGFLTDGANMITILGVDAQWGFDSNGRMEREYLDGISAALKQRTLTPKPTGQPR
jgi:hypothetical protein